MSRPRFLSSNSGEIPCDLLPNTSFFPSPTTPLYIRPAMLPRRCYELSPYTLAGAGSLSAERCLRPGGGWLHWFDKACAHIGVSQYWAYLLGGSRWQESSIWGSILGPLLMETTIWYIYASAEYPRGALLREAIMHQSRGLWTYFVTLRIISGFLETFVQFRF